MKQIKIITILLCTAFTGFAQESFVSFEGNINRNGAVELGWSINNHASTSHFEIQRSHNGSDWTTEGIIFCDANSPIVSHKYIRKCVKPENVSYRIRQVKIDGQESFSHVEIFSTGAIQVNESQNIRDSYIAQIKDDKGALTSKRVML